MNSLRCPRCGLSHTKKNGHTHYHKQNYRCISCGRQFVRDSQRVGDATRTLLTGLLLERLVGLLRPEAEVDELWNFVRRRADRQWLWPAFDKESRQALSFFVGDRSRQSARRLWQPIPAPYRERATFYSDDCEAYKAVIPAERHRVYGRSPDSRAGRALQQHLAAAGVAAGAQKSLVFKEA